MRRLYNVDAIITVYL